ncbi:aldo/keto reductase [Streptomyces sp. NBC_01353]|uniref:aldo/keto reductase n=1 Tax=Streptomyces sp. NBC_01353 TaxID=2903835 RepID=UPI003DA3C3F4
MYAGGNAIDTAVNYRGGESETILDEVLAGRRGRFVLTTKYTVTGDATDPNAGGNHGKYTRLDGPAAAARLSADFLSARDRVRRQLPEARRAAARLTAQPPAPAAARRTAAPPSGPIGPQVGECLYMAGCRA